MWCYVQQHLSRAEYLACLVLFALEVLHDLQLLLFLLLVSCLKLKPENKQHCVWGTKGKEIIISCCFSKLHFLNPWRGTAVAGVAGTLRYLLMLVHCSLLFTVLAQQCHSCCVSAMPFFLRVNNAILLASKQGSSSPKTASYCNSHSCFPYTANWM